LSSRPLNPHLVEGMRRLQSTFATGFNPFRSENGHLFQGRYQARLVEDTTALERVANYIHLNPLRARFVSAEQAAVFRWSSLARFTKIARLDWLASFGGQYSRASSRKFRAHAGG
jgi:putative transposase